MSRSSSGQANEKEHREGSAAINRVIEQISGGADEVEVRNKLDGALEPVLAAIPKRIEEEHGQRRINSLLSSAKLHVGTYLNTLCNDGELDYVAICDREWRRGLERIGRKSKKRMAPQVGLEPTTLRLTAGCSAIELLRSAVAGAIKTRP